MELLAPEFLFHRHRKEFPLGLEGVDRLAEVWLLNVAAFRKAVNQPRTIDYGLTMIVLDLDKEGEGEGRMAIGVELTLDKEKKVLEIENFATEPVRLMEVHKQ